MDTASILFWFVVIVGLSGLIASYKHRQPGGDSWSVVYSAMVLLSFAGWWLKWAWAIYLGFGLWVVLVLLPTLLTGRYHRLYLQQRYGEARQTARLICCLHPSPGWRQQLDILRALELSQSGQTAAALEFLKPHLHGLSPSSLSAMSHFFRITNQWESLREWEEQQRELVGQNPYFISIRLRAYGETGDLQRLQETYERNLEAIRRLNPASQRDICRLMLFAFCGRRAQVERLFMGSLAVLPLSNRQFWLGTADWAAGKVAEARQLLEPLLASADPVLRAAVQRRLEQPAGPAVVPDERILEQAMIEQEQDERFSGRAPFFVRAAVGSQLFVYLNLVVFVVEMHLGSSSDPAVLYRMGAMYAPTVHAGEWWRLFTAVFLHFGPLHLFMNMLAVFFIAPFVELAVGLWRFLFLCLVTGVGSMWFVLNFIKGDGEGQLAVGASGAVMGLIGAMTALMLKGWVRERAPMARAKLMALLWVVAMQFFLDSMIPQVSLTAHLSGLVIGFLLVLGLRDRTPPKARAKV
jgi:rhomboid protease GluP